jgi:hypothetical protein
VTVKHDLGDGLAAMIAGLSVEDQLALADVMESLAAERDEPALLPAPSETSHNRNSRR